MSSWVQALVPYAEFSRVGFVNILAFHVLMMGGAGIAPGAVFSVLELFLLYSYRSYFAPLFTFSAVPTVE